MSVSLWKLLCLVCLAHFAGSSICKPPKLLITLSMDVFEVNIAISSSDTFLEPDLNAWGRLILYLNLESLYMQELWDLQYRLVSKAWCISRRGPLFSAMFNPLFTLIVTVLAALLFHEEIYTGSLIGAIEVIIGLYIVLWGKAEEVVGLKLDETRPNSMVNPPTADVVKLLINESSENAYRKTTDLEQPLLPAQSPIH